MNSPKLLFAVLIIPAQNSSREKLIPQENICVSSEVSGHLTLSLRSFQHLCHLTLQHDLQIGSVYVLQVVKTCWFDSSGSLNQKYDNVTKSNSVCSCAVP